MTRSREKLLFDMLDACRFLIEFSAAGSLDRLRQDRPFRDVVERELQNIGEALFQLRSIDASTASSIPEHSRIIGLRHVLVHGYDAVDANVAWHVVKVKLPILRTELEALLGPGLMPPSGE